MALLSGGFPNPCLRLTTLCGSQAPNLPGTVALTARLLESHNRLPIPGAPMLEVVSCSGAKKGAKGGGNGKAGKQVKLWMEPSGEGRFHVRVLPTCNGLHYSGNTHTEACYHLISRVRTAPDQS